MQATTKSWKIPESADYDVDVIVESSLAMAQATIENAMKDRNLRNADLAQRLNRPRSFVSRIMRGSHNLTVKTLARALAVCGYELTWAYRPVKWGWATEPTALVVVAAKEVPAPAGASFFQAVLA
jgi:transcriptional regulator with XRE-family HTH domain